MDSRGWNHTLAQTPAGRIYGVSLKSVHHIYLHDLSTLEKYQSFPLANVPPLSLLDILIMGVRLFIFGEYHNNAVSSIQHLKELMMPVLHYW